MQDRMEELEAELEQINWSVLGKAETRRKRKGYIKLQSIQKLL